MPDAPREVGQNPADRPAADRQLSRRSLWFVSVLGLAALILGGIQLQRTVKDPFSVIRSQTNTSTPEEVALLQLKAKDTDGDGLSDYDELYAYHTSPYIADSDSDGISDKDEVNRGTDPNCPEGKTCSLLTATNSAENVNALSNTPATGGSGSAGNTAAAPTNATADQLRQALLASGVAKTDLDAIDDTTLLSNYQNVLADEQATNSNTPATVENTNTTNSNTPTEAQLQTLTASEIRQLLISNGVDANTLAGYDDATLLAVYQQALKEANSSTNANTNVP